MPDPRTPVGSMLGRYRLLEEIGAGGMGVVCVKQTGLCPADKPIVVTIP